MKGSLRTGPLLILSIAIGLSACGPAYRVDGLTVGSKPGETAGLRGNSLRNGPLESWTVELNPRMRRNGPADPQYDLQVVYRDPSRWLRIRAGESLKIQADGRIFALAGSGSRTNRSRSILGGIVEEASFPVRLTDLQAIAAAGDVRVQLLGSNQVVEARFSERNRRNVQRFVSCHAVAEPATDCARR